ncbi:MAG: hypothetical protein FJ104_03190, partial [Deltaproteobacteria bacterium]|nr:hypothetical protein [Deltaproteobacteria bacterium]
HLAVYSEIDVALDTFPYHGTTTTCEALSMGVPVVSRVGSAHRSRVGMSVLVAAGTADLATDDAGAFAHAAARAIELVESNGRFATRDRNPEASVGSLLEAIRAC